MARGARYSNVDKKFLASLVKRYGLTGTKETLDRMAGVTLVTLGSIAKENDIELHRGRPSEGKPVKEVKKSAKAKPSGRGRRFTDEQKQEMVASIKERGLTGTMKHFASKGVSVTMPTLWKLAKENGIELHRGRPATVAA